MERNPSEKLTGSQLVTNFTELYGIRRFITAFTCAHNLSLSWDSSIQSMPPTHFLKIHLNIILPFITPGSSKWPLSIRVPHQNTLPLLLFPYILHLLSIHLFSSWSPAWYLLSRRDHYAFTFLHSPVTSSLLGPNILLKTLSVRPSLNVSDQVSHPHKTTDNITVLCIWFFYVFI
jgi:hypothetical protein